MWTKRAILIAGIALLAGVIAYVFLASNTSMENQLTLKSSAFKNGDMIPRRFTCDGENINPFLEIKNAPANTKSFALVVDDPDATNGKTWDHWVMWNIDPKTQYIMEDNIPGEAVEGLNSWGKMKYGGPCPPHGAKPHRYIFTLSALDTVLDLPASSTKADLEQVMQSHVIEKTTLMGLYGR